MPMTQSIIIKKYKKYKKNISKNIQKILHKSGLYMSVDQNIHLSFEYSTQRFI